MEDDVITEDEQNNLLRDVQYIKDRLAILDCVATESRGLDRRDVELMTSAYHEDGWHDFGTVVKHGSEYAEERAATPSESQSSMHHITTHLCEIVGDIAHAESYVMGALLNQDGVTARVLCGRYIDRLEKRDGVWRLAVRRTTVEVAFTADASLLQTVRFRERHFAKGSRDRQDLAYRRPLGIDTPAPDVW
jgi:SnoaL-like domain